MTLNMVHNTLHPKMHPHTDFGIPSFNSNGDMPQTRCEDSGTANGQSDELLVNLTNKPPVVAATR